MQRDCQIPRVDRSPEKLHSKSGIYKNYKVEVNSDINFTIEKKEVLLEAKEENIRLKNEFEKEVSYGTLVNIAFI